MKLRFFGRLRDAVGDEMEIDLPADVIDGEQLRAWLGRDYPVLLDTGVKLAIGDSIPAGPTPLAGAREVSFLPPVSGG